MNNSHYFLFNKTQNYQKNNFSFTTLVYGWILSVIGRVLNSGELLTSIFLLSCGRLSSKLCHSLILLFWRLLFQVFFPLPSYGRLSFRFCITRLTALISIVLSIMDAVKYMKICVYLSIAASVLRNGCICILKDVSYSIPYQKLI